MRKICRDLVFIGILKLYIVIVATYSEAITAKCLIEDKMRALVVKKFVRVLSPGVSFDLNAVQRENKNSGLDKIGNFTFFGSSWLGCCVLNKYSTILILILN